jgi:basic amino acid/polyamine antiporter, APA family
MGVYLPVSGDGSRMAAGQVVDKGQHGRSQLKRSLGMRDGVALTVSNVIGVGIFTTPAIVARLVPQPGAILALWVAGGCLALAGAMSYAELAKAFPSAGGEYVYLRKVYGPVAGFLSGWTSLIAGFSGAVAASAVGLMAYAGEYFPILASDKTIFSVPFFIGRVSFSPRSLGAAAVILVLAAIHICSLSASKLTQTTLALLVTGMVVAFAGFGFAAGHGSWSHLHMGGLQLRPMNWLLALIPVMFTYSGWNAAAYVSEELHDTRRMIGPVLFVGTVTVVALYAALNTLYLFAMPVERMTTAINVGDVAALALFRVGGNFITPVLMVALLGAISAMTVAGPRVYFAMARDGAFIPAFGRTSTRFQTPALAIALQALWSAALVTIGEFEQILMYTGFAIVLSSGAAVAGLLVLERRKLHKSRRLRIRMLIPLAFVVASMAMVVNAIVEAPKTALLGVLFISAGLPIYFWCEWRQSSPAAAESVAASAD